MRVKAWLKSGWLADRAFKLSFLFFMVILPFWLSSQTVIGGGAGGGLHITDDGTNLTATETLITPTGVGVAFGAKDATHGALRNSTINVPGFTFGVDAVNGTNASLAGLNTVCLGLSSTTFISQNAAGVAQVGNNNCDTSGSWAGVTGNSSAPAGSIGEVISSTLASGSSITLSTGTTANVTSVSLTAGDWDCSGAVDFTFGATTSYTNLVGSISTTSATLGAQDSKFDYETAANVPTASADATWPLPTVRQSLASTTTVFLVAQGTFTVSSLKAYGTIRCRRMR